MKARRRRKIERMLSFDTAADGTTIVIIGGVVKASDLEDVRTVASDMMRKNK